MSVCVQIKTNTLLPHSYSRAKNQIFTFIHAEATQSPQIGLRLREFAFSSIYNNIHSVRSIESVCPILNTTYSYTTFKLIFKVGTVNHHRL